MFFIKLIVVRIKTINEDKNVILQNKFKFKRLYENIIDDGRFNELFEEFQQTSNNKE